MGLTHDEVIATNIQNYIDCFSCVTNDVGLPTYTCQIDGCNKKYPENSSSIRHLREKHKKSMTQLKRESCARKMCKLKIRHIRLKFESK